MRALLAAMALVSTTVHAQQVTSPSTLPSAPAALTVPMPLGPPPGTVDLYFRPDNFHSMPPPQTPTAPYPGPVFFPGYGGYAYGYGPYAAPPYVTESPAPAIRVGSLWFETSPDNAQVFVDGNYTGIVQDYGLQGKRLDLAAGTHAVELKAAGYSPVRFAIDITPNHVSRFLGDLDPIPAPAPRPSAPSTYYVIPNCYAGNRPPARPLPRGCDVRAMRTVTVPHLVVTK